MKRRIGILLVVVVLLAVPLWGLLSGRPPVAEPEQEPLQPRIVLPEIRLAEDALERSAEEEEPPEERGVEITVPADLMRDALLGSLADREVEEGLADKLLHTDGAATFIIREDAYPELLQTLDAELRETLVAYGESPDFPAVSRIDCNTGFTQFRITARQGALQPAVIAALEADLAERGTLYQLFAGRPEERVRITFTYLDTSTRRSYLVNHYPA